MTEQEAIGYLKTLPNRIPLKFFTDDGAKVYDKFSKVVTSALEKQMPKKPITYNDTNRADCPCCNSTVRGIKEPFGNWCSNCGQALDWSELE